MELFTLFLRAVLLYAALILTIRVLGKRQLGEFEPYELALTILLADIVSEPIGSVSTPLLYGLLPAMAVICVHGALTLMCMKSDRLRQIISGKPSVVVTGGRIDERELNRLCLNVSDLLEALRGAGCGDVREVGMAIVEANGRVSAFSGVDARLPMLLIADGRVQKTNLRSAGRDEKWLSGVLTNRGVALQSVYLANLNARGDMQLQLRDGTLLSFPAGA